MLKKSSLFILMSLLFVASIILSSCDQATPQPTLKPTLTPTPKISVGIILPSKKYQLWNQVENRFLDAFKTTGYPIQIRYTFTELKEARVLVPQNGGVGPIIPVPSTSYSEDELANINDLIKQGVKVIIINPNEEAEPIKDLKLAKEAGIMAICYDCLIYGTDVVYYSIIFDPVLIGKLQGQYLVDSARGSGNPLYMYAYPLPTYSLVFKGAWGVLQPKIADGTFIIKNSSEAVAVQNSATLTPEEVGKILKQIGPADLNATPSPGDFGPKGLDKVVWDNLEGMTPADKSNLFILALDEYAANSVIYVLSNNKDIKYKLTGAGFSKETLQGIMDGKQSMTVVCDPRVLIGDAITAAEDYLQGETPPQTTIFNNGMIDVPTRLSGALTVIDKNNVSTALIDPVYNETYSCHFR